jgi:threonine/homoserine/homoserine lactone efflux protein
MNPKVALFYLAALPQFVGNTPSAPLIGVGLILTHYVLGFGWLSFIAWGASHASKAVKHTSVMHWVDGLMGALFIGVAGKLALSRS